MNHAEISIRDATEADLDVTADIIDAESGEGPELWRERFSEVLSDSSRHFLVALMNDQVVGFGQSRFIVRDREPDEVWPPDGWYLSGITVDASVRRLGVGTLLTIARLERLRDLTDCVYYVTDGDNEATIELHRRLGFLFLGNIRLPGEDRNMRLGQLIFRV